MLLYNVALVSQTKRIKFNELAIVASAIQKQVTRDFAPIWNIDATVDAFVDLKDVPLGYWSIIIMDDIHESGVAGYHADENNQPFSLVQYSTTWSLTVSHEALEMLADPFGNRLVSADSIMEGQGRVQYLVEVCDPCEDDAFAYTVNGILVSDFYTPNYFNPVTNVGVRYSFTGAIKNPLQVLPGGYLSWLNPITRQWFQATYFGAEMTIQELQGMNNLTTGSLRSRIDSLTKVALLTEGSFKKETIDLKKVKFNAVMLASSAKADQLKTTIQNL